MGDSKSVAVVNEVPVELQNIPRVTSGDEVAVAQKKGGFSISPFTGPSALRSKWTEQNGASLDNSTEGEILIQTGSNGDGRATLTTLRRGVYQSGATGLPGVGIRLGSIPQGGQDVKWGYFDSNEGIGWGRDSEDLYIFLKRNGSVVEKVYRENWNQDPLDGTGTSGLEVDILEGGIFKMAFVWYGYGPIGWKVQKHRMRRGFRNPEPNQTWAHAYLVQEDDTYRGNSFGQPNQPIRIVADNGGEGSNLDIYVGGRSFAILGGAGRIPTRKPTEEIRNYTLTSSQGSYEPLIAVRKKPTYRGYNNPVNAFYDSFSYKTDQDTDFRITIANSIDNANTNWRSSDDWPSGESAVEVATVDESLSVSDDGYPFSLREYATAGGSGRNSVKRAQNRSLRVPFNTDVPVVLWARPESGNVTTVSAASSWIEWH